MSNTRVPLMILFPPSPPTHNTTTNLPLFSRAARPGAGQHGVEPAKEWDLGHDQADIDHAHEHSQSGIDEQRASCGLGAAGERERESPHETAEDAGRTGKADGLIGTSHPGKSGLKSSACVIGWAGWCGDTDFCCCQFSNSSINHRRRIRTSHGLLRISK